MCLLYGGDTIAELAVKLNGVVLCKSTTQQFVNDSGSMGGHQFCEWWDCIESMRLHVIEWILGKKMID